MIGALLSLLFGSTIFKKVLKILLKGFAAPFRKLLEMPLRELKALNPANIIRSFSKPVISEFNKALSILRPSTFMPKIWGELRKTSGGLESLRKLGISKYEDFVAKIEKEKVESILDNSPKEPDYKAKPVGTDRSGIERPAPPVNRWVNVVSAAVKKSMFIPLAVRTNSEVMRDHMVGLILIHFKTGTKNYTYYDRSVDYNKWADCTYATVASKEVKPGVWKPLDGFWSRFLRQTAMLRRGNKKDAAAGYGRIEKRNIKKGYEQIKRLAESKDHRYRSLLKYSGYDKMPTIKGYKVAVRNNG